MWPMPRRYRQAFLAVFVGVSLAASTYVPNAIANALEDVRAGNEFFKAGRLEDAVAAYSKAITSGELQSETLAITYNNRGVALGENGEFDRAIDDYEKALQLLPEDPTTAKNLRVAFVKRGTNMQTKGLLTEAGDDFDRAVEAEPEHYLGYLRRAELNVMRGNLALAVSDYKLALARKPGDSELIAALNQAREALSRPLDSQLAEDVSDETSVAAESDVQPTADKAAAEEAPVPIVQKQEIEDTASEDSPVQPAAASPEPVTPTPADESAAAATATPQTAVANLQDPASSIEPAAGAELMITIGSVNVRDAPANSGSLVATVAEGVRLPVLGEELGWKRVRLSDGSEGYIYRRWLEPVPAQ